MHFQLYNMQGMYTYILYHKIEPLKTSLYMHWKPKDTGIQHCDMKKKDRHQQSKFTKLHWKKVSVTFSKNPAA